MKPISFSCLIGLFGPILHLLPYFFDIIIFSFLLARSCLCGKIRGVFLLFYQYFTHVLFRSVFFDVEISILRGLLYG